MLILKILILSIVDLIWSSDITRIGMIDSNGVKFFLVLTLIDKTIITHESWLTVLKFWPLFFRNDTTTIWMLFLYVIELSRKLGAFTVHVHYTKGKLRASPLAFILIGFFMGSLWWSYLDGIILVIAAICDQFFF